MMTDPAQMFSTAVQLHNAGRLAEAEQLYRQILQSNPRHAATHHNLGVLFQGQKQFAGAVHQYTNAIRLQPDYAPSHNNLGNVLLEQGDVAGAIASYKQALRLQPDFVEALNNYGKLLHDQRRLDEALQLYDRSIALRPDFAIGHYNRARVYNDQNLGGRAIAEYQEALRLSPDYTPALTNLAILYNDVGEPDKALECCRKVLELKVDTGMVRRVVANALRAQGRPEESIAWYRSSLELDPDAAQHSNLLYVHNFLPSADPATVFAEHRAWSARHAEGLTAAAAPHPNDRSLERRLRVGYVSAHFRNHAVNFFVEPILASHDRSRFEVFCYSNVEFPDHVTAQLQTAVDHWRPIRNEPDDRVAQLIRDDAIDILIDLTGHIGENRLLVFALKPAPVQVTYIGYQNTTGMSAMDYRLTDERADPPGVTDRYYTERLVRLPRAFFCYQPGEAPAVSPSPANERGHVTFGSFNLFAKVNAQVIATWIEILARVPDSRLWVLANQGGYAEQKFAEQARARGVDPARVEIHARRPRAEYLRLVSEVDIALDPFPFNGHTTTCDAIWMGVPVVMLEGDAYASRFGGSVLANVGLGELIANSPDQYVDIAVALANDGDKLARLRAELRPRMAASPLMDFVGFTRNLEAAYRQMWADWCAIQAPGQ